MLSRCKRHKEKERERAGARGGREEGGVRSVEGKHTLGVWHGVRNENGKRNIRFEREKNWREVVKTRRGGVKERKWWRAMMYRFAEEKENHLVGWKWFLIDRMDGKFWKIGEEEKGKRKKKWFGPFPSLNVFSNSCVQFPRFLRPRNAPCLSVECSCTMRVSSKRMVIALHVSILLLRLSRVITFVCLWLFFQEIICGNFTKYNKNEQYKISFLVRVIHKISSKSLWFIS